MRSAAWGLDDHDRGAGAPGFDGGASLARPIMRCTLPMPDVRKSVLEATDADSTYRLFSVVY